MDIRIQGQSVLSFIRRLRGSLCCLVKVGVKFWDHTTPLEVLTAHLSAFSPVHGQFGQGFLELLSRNVVDLPPHSSLHLWQVAMLDAPEAFFEVGEKKKITRGEVGTVWRVSKEVLVEDVAKGEIGGVGACVVVLNDEFSVCVSIDPAPPHAWAFLSNPLTQFPECFDVRIRVNCGLCEFHKDGAA